ncbi:MAG TPA: hypothetical protein VN081_05525 [Dongiaceae bacterium]|nr:hypothetical protein [Dongiaceae bacterium]
MNRLPLSCFRLRQQKLFYGLLLSSLALLCWISPVSAHEVETDGTISAILHFSSEDKLVSGQAATYTLFTNDTTHRFSLSGCGCTVTISENGHIVATQVPKQDTNGNATGTFAFPKAGEYDVTFRGEPLQSGAFQAFTLTYEEHVDQGQSFAYLSLTLGLSVGAVVAFAIFYFLRRRRTIKVS